MLEENNKINIDDLLTQANVKNLEKYFNDVHAEISIKCLFERLWKEIRRGEYHNHFRENIFTLVSYIWEFYQKSKGSFELSDDEIYQMFDAVEEALISNTREDYSRIGNSTELEAQALFKLIKDVWDVRGKAESDGLN